MAAPKTNWRSVVLVVIVLATSAWFSGEAVAHPSHVTIGEAEWNRQSKSLEVAIRVNAADLEKSLRRRAKGAKVVLKSGEATADRPTADYVNSRLALYVRDPADRDTAARDTAGRDPVDREADKKRVKLKWVGMEVEMHHVWLYFEFPMQNTPAEFTFENRLFLDLEEDQVNTMIFKVGGRKKTLHFTRESIRREVALNVSKQERAVAAP